MYETVKCEGIMCMKRRKYTHICLLCSYLQGREQSNWGQYWEEDLHLCASKNSNHVSITNLKNKFHLCCANFHLLPSPTFPFMVLP